MIKNLLLLSLLLAGCDVGDLSMDEEFEKKVMCAEYKDEIEKSLEEYNYDTATSVTLLFLDEIFYSPTQNSCLYSAWGSITVFSDSMNEVFDTFYIFDALSVENLYSSDMNCMDENLCVYDSYEARALYDAEILKYKGEAE
jgi:hypothetical protein